MLGASGLLLSVATLSSAYNAFSLSGSSNQLCLPTTQRDMDNAGFLLSTQYYDFHFPSIFTALSDTFQKTGFLEYTNYPLKQLEISQDTGQSSRSELPPELFHSVWITDENNPEPPPLKNLVFNQNMLPSYKTIIWTNIDPDILKSLNQSAAFLEQNAVEIKNLRELNTPFKGAETVLHEPQKVFLSTPKKNLMGIRVDIAKYLVLYQHGGILADLNFVFSKDFSIQLAKDHDFVGAKKWNNRLENYYFIAKPKHPIFDKTLILIEDLLTSNNPTIQYARENIVAASSSYTEFYTMMPLMLGGIMGLNKNGNNDAFSIEGNVPSTGCYSKESKSTSLSTEDLRIIGEHQDLVRKIVMSESREFTFEFIMSKDHVNRMIGELERFTCIDESKRIGTDGKASSWKRN